jgi:hypothetical protein
VSDAHEDLPTARTTLRARYVDLSLHCRSYLQSLTADLHLTAGRGDVPLIHLRSAAATAVIGTSTRRSRRRSVCWACRMTRIVTHFYRPKHRVREWLPETD